MLQNYQSLRELLNPKFTEAQQHYQYRQWLELQSRCELEAAQPLDDNLKVATLVNGLCGNLQQHLLLSVKPTSTWQSVREVDVPNPTTGHIAYLAHGSEENVNYIKGRRKEKGGKEKARKEVTTKKESKGKGKQGDYNKGKGKGYNKGGKGNYQGSWSSWNYQGGAKSTTQCHICKKFGHVAANHWYKDSTYTTAAIGSGTTGQTLHYNLASYY